jgi:hypothetical protein
VSPRSWRGPLIALAACAAVVVFVSTALPRAEGPAARFAATLILLVVAAAVGACSFGAEAQAPRWMPAWQGARRCLWLAAAAGLANLVLGGWAFGISIALALFCGLFAFACGAVAHALGGGVMRVFVAVAACALLATLFFWDDAFLYDAADRKRSVALAFDLNPAAAVSITAGFDWIHAKGLYENNQTAESLVGIELRGVGPYSLRLGAVALVAAVAGLWRKP